MKAFLFSFALVWIVSALGCATNGGKSQRPVRVQRESDANKAKNEFIDAFLKQMDNGDLDQEVYNWEIPFPRCAKKSSLILDSEWMVGRLFLRDLLFGDSLTNQDRSLPLVSCRLDTIPKSESLFCDSLDDASVGSALQLPGVQERFERYGPRSFAAIHLPSYATPAIQSCLSNEVQSLIAHLPSELVPRTDNWSVRVQYEYSVGLRTDPANREIIVSGPILRIILLKAIAAYQEDLKVLQLSLNGQPIISEQTRKQCLEIVNRVRELFKHHMSFLLAHELAHLYVETSPENQNFESDVDFLALQNLYRCSNNTDLISFQVLTKAIADGKSKFLGIDNPEAERKIEERWNRILFWSKLIPKGLVYEKRYSVKD